MRRLKYEKIPETSILRKDVQCQSNWNFEAARRDIRVPIVFIHIPKCAGQAFRHSLADALSVSSIISFFDHSLFGIFDQFETVSAELRASIYGPLDPIPKTAEFVAGHFAVSTVRCFYPKASYCTVLREPISQLLSHWLYLRQHSDKDLAPWGLWGDRIRSARLPLVDFFQDPDLACQTDNLAVRMLLWPDRRTPANDFIDASQDQAVLAEAIATLRLFNFVGFIENPELALTVGKWIGRPFVLNRLNETRRAPAEFPVGLERELTAEAYALLEERSRLDLGLWKEVVERQCPNADSGSIRETVLRSTIEHHKFVQEGRRKVHDTNSG